MTRHSCLLVQFLSLCCVGLFTLSPAMGQVQFGTEAAPRRASGHLQAGKTYSPQRVAQARRLGSAMPVMSEPMVGEEFTIARSMQNMPSGGAEDIGPPLAEGEVIYESEGLAPEHFGHAGGCDSCGQGACTSCSSGPSCNTAGCSDPACDECVPLCLPRLRTFSLFGGVQGFKGPRDGGLHGNFGFNEGVNITGRAPFLGRRGINYQLGLRATQTRLHGSVTPASEDTRTQQFVTAGLFKRRPAGLQWGVVYDMLHDNLIEEIDFSQIRTEISIRGPRGNEVGFMGMFHGNNEAIFAGTANEVPLEPIDQFLGFFRWNFDQGSEARLWAGFSDDDDGIFGGDVYIALNPRWSLASGFNYLIPEADGTEGAIQESWNIGLNIIWHWQCDRAGFRSPFRPMLNVADNGSMIIHQRQ